MVTSESSTTHTHKLANNKVYAACTMAGEEGLPLVPALGHNLPRLVQLDLLPAEGCLALPFAAAVAHHLVVQMHHLTHH